MSLRRTLGLTLLGLQVLAAGSLAACSSAPLSPESAAPSAAGPTPLPAPPGTVQLSLQPPPVAVPQGEIFPLVVLLDTGGQPLQGVQAHLDFDPRTLHVELISGTTGPNGDLQLKSGVDDAGHIDLDLRSSTGTIAAGVYPLATIIFSTLAAPPSTTVRFATTGARQTRALTESGDRPVVLRDATIAVRLPPAGTP